MQNKRGQTIMGMSFGVIVSIIIIIAIISVGVYAIIHFLSLSKCTSIGMFQQDLEDEVDRAWSITPGFYNGDFEGTVPSGIDYVCFGTIDDEPITVIPIHSELQDKFEYEYGASDTHNLFFDPPEKACDGDLFSRKLRHAETDEKFFCIAPENNIVTVHLRSARDEALVTLSKP